MARILLKTTIPEIIDDWHVGRFSRLADTLEAAGHAVTPRNRSASGAPDEDLQAAAAGAYDQVWIMGVDAGGGLSAIDLSAMAAFRLGGRGLLISRDHQDLGASLAGLPVIGGCQNFQSANPEADAARRRPDDVATLTISWPNYHSGRNGDAQSIDPVIPDHPLLARADGGVIRQLPAHPHEGTVSAPPELGARARVVARGRSLTTGVAFNLIVAIEAGDACGGGRVVADSSFHHFSDCNWDPTLGAPSFVSEPWGRGMAEDPSARADAEAYVVNIAAWLGGAEEARP